jgi:hypothetical protein
MWAGIVQWLQQVRLMPPSTSPDATGNPDVVAPMLERYHPTKFHEHPAGSTAQQMSP